MTVVSFSTGSRHGDARAPGALSRILESRRLPGHAAQAGQVHGIGVRIVPKLRCPRMFPRVDGLLTDAAAQPLAIFTADCVPVFLSAEKAGVVGLLHAGWRGVRGGILAMALRQLKARWRLCAADVQLWAGPAIGPCCFDVRWDVARHFPSTRRRSKGGWRIDLPGELRTQAERLGMRWKKKKSLEECTMHGKGHFSYRRNKTDKRQVSVIMKMAFL